MAFLDTEIIKAKLIGKTIKHVEFYNVAEHYFAIDTNKIAVDGAVVISFEDETLAIGWNKKQELIDCVFGNAEDLLQDIPFYQLEEVDQDFNLSGETVQTVDIRWNFFEEFDDNFEIIPGKNYIIEELYLGLSNEKSLQVAAVNCEIAHGAINYIEFNVQGNLLVVVDEKMEIVSVEL